MHFWCHICYWKNPDNWYTACYEMFVYKAIELQYFVHSCDKQHIFIKKKKNLFVHSSNIKLSILNVFSKYGFQINLNRLNSVLYIFLSFSQWCTNFEMTSRDSWCVTHLVLSLILTLSLSPPTQFPF